MAADPTNQEQVTVDSDAGVEPLRQFAERVLAGETPNDAAGLEWRDMAADILALVNARGSLDAAGLRTALTKVAHDPLGCNGPHVELEEGLRALALVNARGSLDAAERIVDITGVDAIRTAVVVEMENEGVVTWGDDGHRARFLALRKTT